MKRLWSRLRPQPLTRRERRFLRTGALVLAVTLLLVYVQIPLWSRRDRGQTRLDLAQARLNTALAAQERLPDLRAGVAALEAEAARAKASLPAGQDEPGLIRSLSQAATAADVDVRELVPGESAAANGVTAFPFRLVAGATPEAARLFLQGLEEMDRLVQIRTFQHQDGVLTLEGTYFASAPGGESH